MDSSHDQDEKILADAIAAINACYEGFSTRVATGDLNTLRISATGYQSTLDGLSETVRMRTAVNESTWKTLTDHIALISDAPVCHGLPEPRTVQTLDLFFYESPYVTWYTAQKAEYEPKRKAWQDAYDALVLALSKYAVGLAQRNVAYCDLKREMEEACASFSACYDEKVAEYLNHIKPDVEDDVKQRIEAYKAGETIVHQVKFLLAEVADQATPAISTLRYQIAYPEVPPKPECDLSLLDDPMWVPTPECAGFHNLLDGCSTGGNVFSAWGAPREERGDVRAGEAICCNSEGKCTRRISSNAGEFAPGLSHEHCITPHGGKLVDGTDGPSWTWSEAKAKCEEVGLRLPENQEEMDTSCNTGCHTNFALAWTA